MKLELAGMTDFGIADLRYTFSTENITLEPKATTESSIISIRALQSIKSGTYTVMVKASDGVVSQLVPITLVISEQGTLKNPILPSFLQSTQFVAIIVRAIIGALILAYRVKSSRKYS